jgi:hypothetical protein
MSVRRPAANRMSSTYSLGQLKWPLAPPVTLGNGHWRVDDLEQRGPHIRHQKNNTGTPGRILFVG